MKMLSLFSGIGGIDLAAQWAGIETVAFCEIDKYCQKVLAKHWPGVPIFDDVRTLTKESLRARGVDPECISVVAGGFPCQDISFAGSGAGINGERSGLWREFNRLICELRPRFVLVENVAALLNRGIDRVLGDLAEGGYNAEWSIVSACAVGAPHTRERLLIVAYPQRDGWSSRCGLMGINRQGLSQQQGQHAAIDKERERFRNQATGCCAASNAGTGWGIEPTVRRVADGVPSRVDRLRALGNAVVPQQIYPIFQAISMESM